MASLAVIGGGIAGLCAARAIKRALPLANVALFEAEESLGGWLQTSHEDGFVFEHGPRSFRVGPDSDDIFQLVEDLGLEEEVVLSDPGSATRFVWHDGLEELPSSLAGALSSPLIGPAVLAAAAARACRARAPREDMSLHDFLATHVDTRVGPIADAFVGGVFAGDFRTLSLRSLAPALWRELYPADARPRSLVAAARAVGRAARAQAERSPALLRAARRRGVGACSFRRGMGTLTGALAAELRASGVRVHTGARGLRLSRADAGDRSTVSVSTASGAGVLHADAVVAALPASALAGALTAADGARAAGAAAVLRQQRRASVAVSALAFAEPGLLPCRGFGYLHASQRRPGELGVIFESNVFPTQAAPGHAPGGSRVTVMAGGTQAPAVAAWTAEEAEARARRTLATRLGVTGSPVARRVRVAREAIPQYDVGHSAWVEAARAVVAQALPGVVLAGNSYDGVGVPASVTSGLRAADEVVRRFAAVQGD